MKDLSRSTLTYLVLAALWATSFPEWIAPQAMAQTAPGAQTQKPQQSKKAAPAKSGGEAASVKRIREIQSYIAELQKTKGTVKDPASVPLLDGMLTTARCELVRLRIETGPGVATEKADLIAQLDQSCPMTLHDALKDSVSNTQGEDRKDKDKTPQVDITACRDILHHDLQAATYLPKPLQAPANCTAVDCKSTRDIKKNQAPRMKTDKTIVATTIQDSGRQESGPGMVQLQYGNRLRFALSVGVKSTTTDAPKISGMLSVANVGGTATAAGAPATTSAKPEIKANAVETYGLVEQAQAQADQFNKTWKSYNACYASLLDQAQQVENSINTAINSTNDTTARYTAVLNAFSQPVLPTADVAAMQSRAKNPAIFGGYYHYTWPDRSLQSVLDDLKAYQLKYALLPTETGYSDWIKDDGNKQAFNYVNANIPQLITELNGISGNSDSAKKLRDAQAAAENWQERFILVAKLQLADFIVPREVACKTWFGASQTNVVNVAYRDLTDASATSDTVKELLTVNCYANITISTGVGFTTLGDRKPDFVPSPADTTKQVLGFTSNSAVRPLYALQTNFSIWRLGDGDFELHGTLGAALGASNDSTATLGFLFGPSVSFRRRTFFITPALHLGQESISQTGFNPGDAKGSLSSPPTMTHWKPSFALTVTFPTSK